MNAQTDDDHPRPIFETVVEPAKDYTEISPEVLSSQEELPKNESSNPPTTPIDQGFDNEHEGGSNTKTYIALGVIFCFVIILSVFLFSKIRNKTITKSATKLVYWGLWEDSSVIEPLIAEYSKSHKNVIIEYTKQDPKDYREKVVVRSKDGRGPDIFRFHNTWVPMMSDQLASLPKDVMTNQEYETTFYKVIQDDLKVGSNYYGIPLYIDDLVLLYNNDFFKRIGVTSPPKTWDELIVYAKQLTVPGADGQPVTSGIALGTANNIEHFSDILGWMLLQNGATLDGVSSIEGQQVLSSYRKFAELPSPVWSPDMPNSIVAFATGKVAMIFSPAWQIANIKSLNPELDFKVAPLPILPGEKEPFSVANYWVEGVSRSSKHQKEAWEFLKFLSSKESMTKIYELATKARGHGLSYSRVDLKDTLLQNDYNAPVVLQAPYLKSIPTIGRTFDDGLNDEIVSYLEDAVNDAQKGISYKDAMEKAEVGIDTILEKYNIKAIAGSN